MISNSLLSYKEVAEIFGITRSKAVYAVGKGLLPPPIKIGNQYAFHKDEIMKVKAFIDLEEGRPSVQQVIADIVSNRD